jgi:tRNA(Ile)-lysidine synthase
VGMLPLPIPGSVTTPNGWRLGIQLLAKADLPAGWRDRTKRWAAYCDAAQIGEAVLTTPQPGLRIAPLGLGGRHKALGDLFTDSKTPLALREGWPLVVDRVKEQVIWVCGLAVAEPVRVAEATKTVIALLWQPAPKESCAAM